VRVQSVSTLRTTFGFGLGDPVHDLRNLGIEPRRNLIAGLFSLLPCLSPSPRMDTKTTIARIAPNASG
jgi:hypothetical protein